jgi:apolipoprotein N-acyltransferase
VLAYAPFELFPVAALALGVLFWLLGPGAPEALCSASLRAGAGQASASASPGARAMLAGVSWLYVALNRFGGCRCPGGAGDPALLRVHGCFRGFSGRSSARCARAGRGVMRCSLPAWLVGEWVRGWAFTGFRGWPAATARVRPARWRASRRCSGCSGGRAAGRGGGAGGGGNGHAQLATGAAGAAARGRRRRAAPGRLDRPGGRAAAVALLQPNIEQSLKWRPEMLQHWLEVNLSMLRSNPAQLVVLPETTIPLLIDHLPPDYRDALARTAARMAATWCSAPSPATPTATSSTPR